MPKDYKAAVLEVLMRVPGTVYSTTHLRDTGIINTGMTQDKLLSLIQEVPGVMVYRKDKRSYLWCYTDCIAAPREYAVQPKLKDEPFLLTALLSTIAVLVTLVILLIMLQCS
jgi:hypothetical protein